MATDGHRITALIWDVDGTLSNTHDLCVEGLRGAIAEHGGPRLAPKDVEALFGPTEEGILAGIVPEASEAAMESYVAFYERGHDNGVAFEGVTELVLDLHRLGVRQGVVTGKGARTAAITLRALGLDGVLAPVMAGSENGSIKADAMRAVLDGWGLDPDAVAYLGDIPSDVTHARTAGVVPVSVAWKPDSDRAALAAVGPDALVEDVTALRTWLRETMDLDL